MSVSSLSSYYNYSSSLFTNTSASTTTGVSDLTSLLGDYSSIKSGSYKKLLVEYYKNEAANETSEGDSKTTLTTVSDEASALRESSAALRTRGTDSVFEKKTIKVTDEETGEITEETDYDRDAISKAINQFVEDYNNLIETAGSLETNSILQKTVNLTNITKSNSKLLAEVGITVGSNNQLTIDESKLKEADISTLKTLFNGTNSFADKVNERARQIQTSAAIAIADTNKTYNNSGSYNLSTGTLYNSLY